MKSNHWTFTIHGLAGLVVILVNLLLVCRPRLAEGADPGVVAAPRAFFHHARLTIPSTGQAGFTLLDPRRTGLAFTNQLSSERSLTNQIFLNGSGVALGDVDGDGWCDVFLCGLDNPNALYRNLGGWRFQEITEMAGVGCPDQASTGAAFLDVEGDGDLDLLVSGIARGARLFINDGRGHFQESTDAAGLRSRAGSMSMTVADIDGDGLLDFYLVNYRSTTFRDEPEKRFSVARKKSGNVIVAVDGQPVSSPDLVGRFTADASLGLLENGEADILYRNLGSGTFEALRWTNGTFLTAAGQTVAVPYDWGLGAMFRDLNGDGAPDLYVCNDFQSPDRVWINTGKGRFQELPPLAIRQSSLFSMGIDFADVDRDGNEDFFVADMLSRSHSMRQVQISDRKPQELPLGVLDNRPQYSRNTLHLNRGDGTYAEAAQMAGLAASDWSWCPVFLDVDLDGFEDLLVTTGHARDAQNIDIARRMEMLGRQKTLSWSDKMDMRRQIPPLMVKNVAFRNGGRLNFEEVGTQWGFDSDQISQGMALADLDGDGALDVVVNCLNAGALVYRNQTVAPRLAVRLRGNAPNTRGIGAKIRVVTEGLPMQQQEMICGGRYLSSDDTLRVFASGSSSKPQRIEVIWRSGARSVVESAQANGLYEIEESGGAPPTESAGRNIASLFEDVSKRVAFSHVAVGFDDFARQPLLPFKLSQSGPGVGWFDVNGDGWEDLMVSATGKGGIVVFQGDAQGQFTPDLGIASALRTSPDGTTLLGSRQLNQTVRLYLASTHERESPTPSAGLLEYSLPSKTASQVPTAQLQNAGPLALADVQGDGSLSLFVGGRSPTGRFPEPASSLIFRIDHGQLALDVNRSHALANVGFVSSCVWSDLNNDGKSELILAMMNGPLRVWQARDTHLVEITAELGLDAWVGWWNSVQVADFDEDGLQDIVAGNWGRNSRYQAYLAGGLRTFYGDFDNDGAVEVIEAYSDPMLGKTVPWKDWESLSKGLPFLREQFDSFTSFGKAGIQEILGDRAGMVSELKANTLDSMVFLNRGNRFSPRSLPVEAQLSPVFGLATGDLNGDGHEDVIVSQNFSPVSPEVSRYDAGRGLVLLGDGRGELRSVSGQASGISVYGDGRGTALCDFDHDGKLDVAIAQNSQELKLYHNREAKPGLRVVLKGSPGNFDGIGSVLRLEYRDGTMGPAREVHAGGGYWSQDASTVVMGFANTPKNLHIRWPSGLRKILAIPAGAKEIVGEN